MDKVTFYRAFYVALYVFFFLLRWVIFLAQQTLEFYEDQNPDGIRYSKLLVGLRIFLVLQSYYALEAAISTLFLSQMELDRFPEPGLLRLLKHFVSKFSARSLNVITVLCLYMFFRGLLRKNRDGMPFLVILFALLLYRFYLI